MTSPLTTWLLAIPALLQVLFYIAAVIFVISRRSDQSSAKTFAVMGIAILLVVQIAGPVTNILIANSLGSTEYVFYHGLIAIVTTLLHLLAVSLLIAAVFVGRSQETPSFSHDKITPVPSKNPYTPPTG